MQNAMAKKKTARASKNNFAAAVFKTLGLSSVNRGVFDGEWRGSGKMLQSFSPNDGGLLAEIQTATPEEYERAAQRAAAAFQKWQTVPAPRRGEIIRQLGN